MLNCEMIRLTIKNTVEQIVTKLTGTQKVSFEAECSLTGGQIYIPSISCPGSPAIASGQCGVSKLWNCWIMIKTMQILLYIYKFVNCSGTSTNWQGYSTSTSTSTLSFTLTLDLERHLFVNSRS